MTLEEQRIRGGAPGRYGSSSRPGESPSAAYEQSQTVEFLHEQSIAAVSTREGHAHGRGPSRYDKDVHGEVMESHHFESLKMHDTSTQQVGVSKVSMPTPTEQQGHQRVPQLPVLESLELDPRVHSQFGSENRTAGAPGSGDRELSTAFLDSARGDNKMDGYGSAPPTSSREGDNVTPQQSDAHKMKSQHLQVGYVAGQVQHIEHRNSQGAVSSGNNNKTITSSEFQAGKSAGPNATAMSSLSSIKRSDDQGFSSAGLGGGINYHDVDNDDIVQEIERLSQSGAFGGVGFGQHQQGDRVPKVNIVTESNASMLKANELKYSSELGEPERASVGG